MDMIISAILGLIQGLTEFIPVSSSGHVVVVERLMGSVSDHLFLEWINIGTVLALILFFRHRLYGIAHDVIRNRNYRLFGMIILAALPAGLVGFFLASYIESSSFFTNIWTVVTALFVVGVVLIVLEKLPKMTPVKGLEQLTWRRALGVGVAQVLSLIPGTSRSGSTIIAGRLLGLSREHAAEFSFLVSIPVMLGVLTKLLLKPSDRDYLMLHLDTLLIANVVAFIAGMFAVGFLMKYLKRRSLAPFGWYRIVLAVVVAVIILLQ